MFRRSMAVEWFVVDEYLGVSDIDCSHSKLLSVYIMRPTFWFQCHLEETIAMLKKLRTFHPKYYTVYYIANCAFTSNQQFCWW